MKHVFWTIRGRLGGRPGPDRAPWSLTGLRSSFDVVVNLSEHPSPERDLSALGFDHVWIPLPTAVPPDVDAERACLKELPTVEAYVAERLHAGRRVLVHCVSGKDRTGLLLAYHLARRSGFPAEEAIKRVRGVRPIALNAEGWEAMAMRVISTLRDLPN